MTCPSPTACLQSQCAPPDDLGYLADIVTLWQIADFGVGGANETAVAALINADSEADFILTAGDNDFLGNYATSVTPYYGDPWKNRTKFHPVPGENDWAVGSNLAPYLAYFTHLQGQRYYSKRFGIVEVFMLDSSNLEPDGITAGTLSADLVPSGGSLQWRWFVRSITGSKALWKIVVLHHPPYSSGAVNGSNVGLQWQFSQLGASLVLSGHARSYERLAVGGLPFIVNGAGGQTLQGFGTPLATSLVRYNTTFGALKLVARPESLVGTFQSLSGTPDTFTITR